VKTIVVNDDPTGAQPATGVRAARIAANEGIVRAGLRE
jgi:hypothetical protein